MKPRIVRAVFSLCFLISYCVTSDAAILVLSPDGSYTTKPDIEAARSAPDAAGKTIHITADHPVSADTLWPADRNLVIDRGGRLTIANGKILTFETGSYFPPVEYQVFAGSGKVSGLTNVTPQMWGAKNDNSSVSTTTAAAIAAYATGANVYWPQGSYLINNTIVFSPQQRTTGAGRGKTWITQINDKKFAFQYLSALSNGPYDINSGGCFDGITISAKNAIQLNQEGDFSSLWDKQAHIKGFVFKDIYLTGKYQQFGDPNKDTSLVPAFSELKGYGIGISLSKCFDTIVDGVLIENFGVGVIFDGCDISQLERSRFQSNARNIHVIGHDTYGAQVKISHNDILGPSRVGGVYLDNTAYVTLEDNYFEGPGQAANFIKTNNDIGTRIIFNRIDNSTIVTTTPFMSLAPQHDMLVGWNRFGLGTTSQPIEFLSTHWTVTYRDAATFVGNSAEFPVPDKPAATVGYIDPKVFTYNNMFFPIGGGVTVGNAPFAISPVTGRYALRRDLGTAIVTFPCTKGQSAYTIKYTGLNFIPGDGGYHVVTHIKPDGGLVILSSGYLGFTATTESQTISETVHFGTSETRGGKIKIELVNTNAEYERIEIM